MQKARGRAGQAEGTTCAKASGRQTVQINSGLRQLRAMLSGGEQSRRKRKDVLFREGDGLTVAPPYSTASDNQPPKPHSAAGGGLETAFPGSHTKRSQGLLKENTRKGSIEHKCDFSWLFPTLPETDKFTSERSC